MKNYFSKSEFTRRQFLGETAARAGAIGLSATALVAAKAQVTRKNPYEYDVERLRVVDSKLIHFESIKRFATRQPEPHRMTLGPDQRIYLAAGKRVCLFDREGLPLQDFSVGAEARSLAVTGEGVVFVGARDHVEVYDSKGNPIAVWPKLSGKPLITGIAVGEKDVFLADAGNRIVWRCDRSGKLVRRIGERDTQRNIPGFVVPSPFFDIELGADGLLRVTNPGRHRVEAYTADGDLEASWGRPGAGIEGFCGCCNPINIELLKDGRVVTFEKGLARVKVYSAAGEMESVVAAPASFANALRDQCEWADCSFGGLDGAVGAEGRIYVLDLITGDIQIFSKKVNSQQPAPRTG
jgi:hypothetical protein